MTSLHRSVGRRLVVGMVAFPLVAAAQVEPLGRLAYKPNVFNGYPAQAVTSKYMVALLREGLDFPDGFICGASVIANGWALTAAHCLYDRNCARRQPETLYGVAGRLSLVGTLPKMIATDAFTHPGFKCVPVADQIAAVKEGRPLPMGNDIALIAIEGLAVPARPLVLPSDGSIAASTMMASGWGTLGNGSMSYQLMSVNLQPVAAATCASAWQPSSLSADQLCVGPPAKGPLVGICSGDSGGPLVGTKNSNPYQAGLVSLGHLVCNNVDRPSLFTNVVSHRAWIEGLVGKANLPGPAPACTPADIAAGIC